MSDETRETADIRTLQAKRFELLKFLYDNSRQLQDGQLQSVHAGVIQGALGISPAIRSQIEDYLSKRGLIEIAAMGPELAITVRGIDYVEAALVEPDRPTEYFPPASTLVMHVHGGIHGSQIQQGTVHSVQTNMQAPFDIAALLGIVASVKAAAANVPLDRRERDELHVDFATIELQGR